MSEYCPHCHAVRNITVEVARRRLTLPDGSVRPVRIRSCHCGSCRRFIRSEEIEETAGPKAVP